ncbi:alpha/beta-hydrolase [Auricularia subglabra TFB-10046 SS5]|nr:alpha/beta-hydrolase [Auricularia subglabra TFB-10046 SS5]
MAAKSTAAPAQALVFPDGRTLSYAVYGDSSDSAATIFYFHGFPGSHAEAAPYHLAALARNLRVVAVDRPGMGESTFQPNRRLLDWPTDVLALADHLSVRRFAVIGMSGGAPYALACAHALPKDRLGAVALVSGWFPYHVGRPRRVVLWLSRWCTPLVRLALALGPGRSAASRERLRAFIDGQMADHPPPDRAVYEANERGIRDSVIESVLGSFRQGARGLAWDARLYYDSHWGFTLDQIDLDASRLFMWHGAWDDACPLPMAQQAATVLKGAELLISPGEGHLSLAVHKADDVLDVLKRSLA